MPLSVRIPANSGGARAVVTSSGVRIEMPPGVPVMLEKIPVGSAVTFADENGRRIIEIPFADIAAYRLRIDPDRVVLIQADSAAPGIAVVPPTTTASAAAVLNVAAPPPVTAPAVTAAPSLATTVAPGASQPGAAPTAVSTTKTLEEVETAAREKLQSRAKDALNNWDRPIPESPAFTALGLTTETVTRPSSPRELATSLMNGLDTQGNFKSGIALDFAPFQIFAGKGVTLEDYRNDWTTRFLFNSQVSFATAKGVTDDDKSFRAALGFHFTFFDEGDPRRNTNITAAYSNFAAKHPLPRPNPFGDPDKAVSDYISKSQADFDLFQQELAELRKRTWSQSSWTMALAPTFASDTADSDGLKFEGLQGWTAYAYGFKSKMLESKAQLIVNARFRLHEFVYDETTKALLYKEDSVLAGARLRFGLPDFNGSIEGAYMRTWSPVGNDHSYRVSLAIERKIAPNVWLTISGGKNFDQDVGPKKDSAFIVGAFRFGLSEKATLNNETK
jgi:hypothetical protein